MNSIWKGDSMYNTQCVHIQKNAKIHKVLLNLLSFESKLSIFDQSDKLFTI